MNRRGAVLPAILGATALAVVFGYVVGSQLAASSVAKAAPAADQWSPTGRYPTHEVYFPGTEALAPDEIMHGKRYRPWTPS